MDENCLFRKIAAKKIPAKLVFEDDDVFAFEDISPQAPIHILICPKKHFAALHDAAPEDQALLGKLLSVAGKLATERNLQAAGFTGYARLNLVPPGAHFASAADFKAPIRAGIEQAGYTIIANMGDQPSDLLGGHAEKKFLLPDPFYRVP